MRFDFDELRNCISGALFMRRWFLLSTSWIQVRIHEIESEPPYYHDHPWCWAFSFILRGGYVERILDGKDRVRRWGSVAYIKGDRWHRLDRIKRNTTTLLIVGPSRKSSDCFYDSSTKQYIPSECVEVCVEP